MFSVECEQAARQSERLDQFRRGRDLVALFGNHHMREHDSVGVAQRRHHMRGLAVVERVETAAQCFAVDGDRGQPLDGGGFDKLTAWRRNAASSAVGSTPCRISRKPQ